MQIEEIAELKNQIYSDIRDKVTKEREGTHLSDLILCLRKPYFRSKGLSAVPSDDLCVLWLSGFAFQEYMFPNMEETFELDGIRCSPDVKTGMEVKSTRQSMGRFNPYDMHHWIKQILGYMKVLRIEHYYLVVFFVCGDYKPPFPAIKAYKIQATKEEIDLNWKEMLKNKGILEQAIADEVLPPNTSEPWEWEYCDCWELCTDTTCNAKRTIKEQGGKKS